MRYVDGFILPIKKTKIKSYQKMSRAAGKIWKEYGALDYKECVGDDLSKKGFRSFPLMAKARKGEAVVFAFITYKSKAHRNAVNAKVMKDPRIADLCNSKEMPFDLKRMSYGGFKVFVDPK